MSGLKIHTIRARELRAVPKYMPTERLSLNADGQAVPETDPSAVGLFCIPGRAIPMDAAIAAGLVKVEPDEADEAPATRKKPETKPAGAETKPVDPEESKKPLTRSQLRKMKKAELLDLLPVAARPDEDATKANLVELILDAQG